jgi:hypothetical protein
MIPPIEKMTMMRMMKVVVQHFPLLLAPLVLFFINSFYTFFVVEVELLFLEVEVLLLVPLFIIKRKKTILATQKEVLNLPQNLLLFQNELDINFSIKIILKINRFLIMLFLYYCYYYYKCTFMFFNLFFYIKSCNCK